jgi:hypothetical protein
VRFVRLAINWKTNGKTSIALHDLIRLFLNALSRLAIDNSISQGMPSHHVLHLSKGGEDEIIYAEFELTRTLGKRRKLLTKIGSRKFNGFCTDWPITRGNPPTKTAGEDIRGLHTTPETINTINKCALIRENGRNRAH